MIIARVSPRRLYSGLKFYFNQTVKVAPGIYNIKNINTHGDQINLEPEKKTQKEFADLKALSPDHIKSSELSVQFIKTMNNYIVWAQNNNICIIAMPPNHLYFDEYREKAYLKFLINIRSYYNSQNIAYLGNPYDYMYPEKYYFNTSYHLNSLGIQKRTSQIIEDVGLNPETHCDTCRAKEPKTRSVKQ